MIKSKLSGKVQEVVLPDFPDDENTVTKSRRVSFGTNFVKEFIVGSAVSAQCMSEYEQAFPSSDSSNADSSHSAAEIGILDHSTFVVHDSLKVHKSGSTLIQPPESNSAETRPKLPKFSSTICFSADSPTADMEFTEGCITLAKSILDKKNKEMTVIIQSKPKEAEKPREEETKYFDASEFEMSMTGCLKSKENKQERKRFESEKTKIFSKFEDEMSITRCTKVFNNDEIDSSLEDCKENQVPLDVIMRHLDKDNSDLESDLFNPERSFNNLLNENPFDFSNDSEKLNLNESMDISTDFQPQRKAPNVEVNEIKLSGINFSESVSLPESMDVMEMSTDQTNVLRFTEKLLVVEKNSDLNDLEQFMTSEAKEDSADAPQNNLEMTKNRILEEKNPELSGLEELNVAETIDYSAVEPLNAVEMSKNPVVDEKNAECNSLEKCNPAVEIEYSAEAIQEVFKVSANPAPAKETAEPNSLEKSNPAVEIEYSAEAIQEVFKVSANPAPAKETAEPNSLEKSNPAVEIEYSAEALQEVFKASANPAPAKETAEPNSLEKSNPAVEIEYSAEALQEVFKVSANPIPAKETAELSGLEKFSATDSVVDGAPESPKTLEVSGNASLTEQIKTDNSDKLSLNKTVEISTAVQMDHLEHQQSMLPNNQMKNDTSDESEQSSDLFREPSLVDIQVIENLKEQSKEPGCMWSLKDWRHPQAKSPGLLSFNCEILESTATILFNLKTSNVDTIDSCSLVKDSEVNLNEEEKCRLTEYELVIEFGFQGIKRFFLECRQKVQTIRHIPYFLDQINSFVFKMNSYLRQIHSILTLYPGSRLRGSLLSFRLFSFPIFLSCVVTIDLSNLFRLSRTSLSFENDFGSLDENKIRDIFQECLKIENSLGEFVVRSTKYLIDLEKPFGYLSKRQHIRLLPPDLKL